MQGQTSYYRNSDEGQWRYYQLTKDMTPKTVDWKMFLGTEFGLAPDQPFNRARYAQWRCYWDFGGGMYTDLFVHQLTHLILAMGVRFPRRVVGAGGLYLEYDGRDVPDVATVVADYDEGCQVLISATMCNDVQLGEVIRGHTGDDHVRARPTRVSDRAAGMLQGQPAPPGAEPGQGRRAVQAAEQPGEDTRALWDHFLECIRSRNPETLCPAELGYAAIATVNLGVQSYREGKAYYFDKETGEVSRRRHRLGRSLGRTEQASRQAQPGHRLEGRRPRARCSSRPTTRSSKATGSTARTRPHRPELPTAASIARRSRALQTARSGITDPAARLAVGISATDPTASARVPAAVDADVRRSAKPSRGPAADGGRRPGRRAAPGSRAGVGAAEQPRRVAP